MSTSRPPSIAMIMSSASSTTFEYSSFPVGRPLPRSQFQAPFRPPYCFLSSRLTQQMGRPAPHGSGASVLVKSKYESRCSWRFRSFSHRRNIDSFLDDSAGGYSVCWVSFPGKRSFLGNQVPNSEPPVSMNRGAVVRPVSGLTDGHAAAFTGGAVQNRTGGRAQEWTVRRSASLLRLPWPSGR